MSLRVPHRTRREGHSRVRDARLQLGLTQPELATFAGVCRMTVSRLENNFPVSCATRQKVFKVLALS